MTTESTEEPSRGRGLRRALNEHQPASLLVAGILLFGVYALLAHVARVMYAREHASVPELTVSVADAWAILSVACYFGGIALCAWACVRQIADAIRGKPGVK